ncbi:Alpha/Beta hydrolase protein [Apodospora peruviana]|uniref:Carboxylic ester hydrolase n=1 Tax=Apodospora peruviana TaxID=516989 RepID=A0AAE0LYT6_9PEZI|nr:Alpha/Beta hydrolase protein [Apodospora peruviana]
MDCRILHDTIGPVEGTAGDGYRQFLGIKYATLKNRFAEPELVRYDGGCGIDATRYGPTVIGPEMGVDHEFSLIQQSLPKPAFQPSMSDVDGLNLNITTPDISTTEKAGKPLFPVLVFIHGGGFGTGGNWWPQYDFGRLVKLSNDLGTPIIGVSINYRVGALGFMTSPELRAAGYKPNNGLRDQRAALRWVRENISGFGGDPDNVTVMGQSAGAVSCGYLLLSEEKLARRLICLGGRPPLMGMQPLEVADKVAESAIAAALALTSGLQEQDGFSNTDIVDRLLDLPATAMEKLGLRPLPTIDGDIIPMSFTFESFARETAQMAGTRWIESMLLVCSSADASIIGSTVLLPRKRGIAAAFRASAAKTLCKYPEALASLLDEYSLSSTNAHDEDQVSLLNIVRFMSDVEFFLPAVDLAAKFPNEAFVAAFNEPNPWDGPFSGIATHILDVAFLLQNFNDRLNPTQRVGAVAFGADAIAFVNGDKTRLWEAFNRGGGEGGGRDGNMGVYANGKRIVETAGHRVLFELADGEKGGPGLDLLSGITADFLGGLVEQAHSD